MGDSLDTQHLSNSFKKKEVGITYKSFSQYVVQYCTGLQLRKHVKYPKIGHVRLLTMFASYQDLTACIRLKALVDFTACKLPSQSGESEFHWDIQSQWTNARNIAMRSCGPTK